MKILTPREYSQITGLNINEIKKQCNLGNIEHFKTAGGYYKIKYFDDTDKDKEALIKENAELKQKLKTILSIIGG